MLQVDAVLITATVAKAEGHMSIPDEQNSIPFSSSEPIGYRNHHPSSRKSRRLRQPRPGFAAPSDQWRRLFSPPPHELVSGMRIYSLHRKK